MKKSEIRKDYFLDRYVIIAPVRNSKKRPHFVAQDEIDGGAPCRFCPELVDDPSRGEVTVLEKKDTSGKWRVKVIENLFPALSPDNLKAYGKQEIVIETPVHNKEIHELSISHIVDVIDSYIERYNALKNTEGISYVIVFKNEGGKAAGASVAHTHSQIIALPMIPPKIAEESDAMDNYIQKHCSCPFCDIMKAEKNGPRVIWEDDHFFVLSPYASESPYGAWFIPKRHIHSMEMLHEGEKESLAKAFKKILRRLDDIHVPYNYFFQNSLDCESHHMIIKLAPRPNVWAGLELGTGVVINPVPPEDAVKFYQEELVEASVK